MTNTAHYVKKHQLEERALFNYEVSRMVGKARKYRMDPAIPLIWDGVPSTDLEGNQLTSDYVAVVRYVLPDKTINTVVYPVDADDQVGSYIPLYQQEGRSYAGALKDLGYVESRRQLETVEIGPVSEPV